MYIYFLDKKLHAGDTATVSPQIILAGEM